MAFPGNSQDIDNLVRLESERLKLQLQEDTRRRTIQLIQTLNHRASNLLQQKDAQILQANQRTMELQAHLNRAQIELDAWRARASAGKGIAQNLLTAVNHATQHYLARAQARVNPQLYSKPESPSSSVGSNGMAVSQCHFACKVCDHRESCMILLPCRHLCCCKPCTGSVNHCPVCGSIRKTALEVSMK